MPVVGSANLDVVISLQVFPAPGETVMGDHLEEVAGGKGLNQSVAAAHEAACAFVGCAGDDGAGRLLTEALVQARVDVSQITRTPQPTGRDFFEATPDDTNRIVVMALANGLLDAADVTAALDALGPAVALVQLERSVVVTDGPDGAHAGTSTTGIAHAPGQRVTPVDTSGAGDVFAGTLAAHLSHARSPDAPDGWSYARTYVTVYGVGTHEVENRWDVEDYANLAPGTSDEAWNKMVVASNDFFVPGQTQTSFVKGVDDVVVLE